MIEIEKKYISGLANIERIQDLTDYSIQYFKDELRCNEFTIIHHRTHPQPYNLIYPSHSKIELDEIQDDIFKSVGQNVNINKIKSKKYNYYFFNSILATGNGKLYLSELSIKEDIESILQLWNFQESILSNSINKAIIQINEQHAGLASQLMHDIQSIINLTANTDKSNQLSRRIEYQKKVNKNFLFWTRECDLMKTNVSIKELLESSLQIAGVESSIIDLDICLLYTSPSPRD